MQKTGMSNSTVSTWSVETQTLFSFVSIHLFVNISLHSHKKGTGGKPLFVVPAGYDIKILFRCVKSIGQPESIAQLWLNSPALVYEMMNGDYEDTGARASTRARKVLTLQKHEIDYACKDKKCWRFPKDFSIETFYESAGTDMGLIQNANPKSKYKILQ